ncbi:pyrroloquinoline quinone precursor peptide PqqA [Noviherbaspirillum suwonense]|jgi:coenzyme PQQ precursor peptide PqqA|uniref:Coenzyme PQQ synthesis protein A n=1 Tax=Noviherbaspirillum suwonense TaxID=1224511 RepID=A0ABY1QJV2_9BURK|nr:pyrroloquinoline quinone precursor peptide PqqA [Noviherbaspirillum suwonense]SMP73532.1 coenzyme PQQ precursor peptide PqqA [Noviherbaspirillum suwonense]
MDLPLRPAGARHRMNRIRDGSALPGACSFNLFQSLSTFKENRMIWEKPQAVDMRWGFEITMYIANR